MSQTATKSINNVKAHSIWNIRSLTIMALMTALLIVSTYIKIPLPFSSASITAQTLMVNLIGLLLSPLQTLAVMVTWILLSVVGIGGSLGKLLGPAGGYRYGNLVAAVMISMFCCKVKKVRWQTAFIIIVGIPVIYLFGADEIRDQPAMGCYYDPGCASVYSIGYSKMLCCSRNRKTSAQIVPGRLSI